ncbi:MAG TPA: hypothetical protein VFH95_04910 [Candidatus Kapabacteria bacterium]|nr:hypothetical protein [Candidatus Kapabacteria bacterium]
MLRAVLLGFVLYGLLLVGLAPRDASAQNVIDTSSAVPKLDTISIRGPVIPNEVHLGFDHVLSIYDWSGLLKYVTPAAPGSGIQANDTVQLGADSRYLQDNLITTTSTTGFVYADDPLGGGALAPFIAFAGNSYVTSGLPGVAATSLITRQVNGFGVAGLRYRPGGSDLDFSASGGLAQESQSDINTMGSVVRGSFRAPAELLNENTMLSASAMADERFFQQRAERYSNDLASLAAISSVGGPSTLDSNHAYLDAGLERRDFFFGVDSNGVATNAPTVKQERTDLSLSLRDSLNYPIVPNALTSTIDAEFEPSSITRQSDISASALASSSASALSSLLVPNQVADLRLAFAGRLDLVASTTWTAQARMSYEEKTEDVSLLSNELPGVDPSTVTKFASVLQESSYSQRITQASASAQYAPDLHDTIAADINAHLLNYDVPSPLNDDAHDILITSATARYGHLFSNALDGGLELRATNTHLVYLKGTRSAQNNVSQSLALATHADYWTPALLARVSGEVFANYTVLDYLDSVPILQGIGNYLLRGLTLSDSIMFPLALLAGIGPVTFEEGATLHVNERGSYDVPSFSELLDTRITDLSATLLLGIHSSGGLAPWTIRAGVQGFILSRSGPNTTLPENGLPFEELERQTRIGPLLTVSFLRWQGVGPVLMGTAWYAVIKDQTFDVPSVTRTPELESHLSVQWTF